MKKVERTTALYKKQRSKVKSEFWTAARVSGDVKKGGRTTPIDRK